MGVDVQAELVWSLYWTSFRLHFYSPLETGQCVHLPYRPTLRAKNKTKAKDAKITDTSCLNWSDTIRCWGSTQLGHQSGPCTKAVTLPHAGALFPVFGHGWLVSSLSWGEVFSRFVQSELNGLGLDSSAVQHISEWGSILWSNCLYRTHPHWGIAVELPLQMCKTNQSGSCQTAHDAILAPFF